MPKQNLSQEYMQSVFQTYLSKPNETTLNQIILFTSPLALISQNEYDRMQLSKGETAESRFAGTDILDVIEFKHIIDRLDFSSAQLSIKADDYHNQLEEKDRKINEEIDRASNNNDHYLIRIYCTQKRILQYINTFISAVAKDGIQELIDSMNELKRYAHKMKQSERKNSSIKLADDLSQSANTYIKAVINNEDVEKEKAQFNSTSCKLISKTKPWLNRHQNSPIKRIIIKIAKAITAITSIGYIPYTYQKKYKVSFFTNNTGTFKRVARVNNNLRKLFPHAKRPRIEDNLELSSNKRIKHGKGSDLENRKLLLHAA